MKSRLHAPPAPPLIQAKGVPPWLVVRDLVLTAIAWLAIIQSMRLGIYLLYDYFSPPIFEVTRAALPHFLEIWNPLKGFVLGAVCLVIWLAFWALYGTRRFRAKPPAPQPTPLSLKEHTHYFGVNEQELARWRSYRIAMVAFNTDHRVAGVSQLESAPAIAVASGRG